MSDLTAGNWIAYQNEAQKRDIDEHGQRWSIGLDNPVEFCRGVNGSDYMLVSGICTEADAKAMAASKDLLAALKHITELPNYRCVAADMRKLARAALSQAGGASE